MQLTLPDLNQNEYNAGLIMKEDGTPDYWLIVFTDDEPVENTHEAQMEWAKGKNADLPNKREIALARTNARKYFKDDRYWTNETHADNAGWAWCQNFRNGLQNSDTKYNKLRARAVRRVLVI